ncbi:Ran-binding protein 9 [Nowakowskiella sp. JEL0078]|nr:Ran-binding protein 9 [Nowakowskiella sp. JEL0078]
MTEPRRTTTIYRSHRSDPPVAVPVYPRATAARLVPYYLGRQSTLAPSTTKVGNASREAAQLIAARLRVPSSEIVAPVVAEDTALFPSGLSGRDRCAILEVGRGGLRVKYEGDGRSDAALVRTDCSIPSECGVYYFEVDIISKGRDGFVSTVFFFLTVRFFFGNSYIGIGFGDKMCSTSKLPGLNFVFVFF